MVQIIKEFRNPSSSEKFGQAFANFGKSLGGSIPQLMMQREQKMQMQQENEAAKRLGIDLSGIQNPEMRKMALQYAMMGQNKQQEQGRQFEFEGKQNELTRKGKADELSGKKEKENKENIAPFQNALETIKEMRKIGSKGNLGFNPLQFFGEGGKDRGKYEQLGKSLISMASNIPIRNQAEFNALAEHLYDPMVPDKQREGILEAMEEIIRRSMSQYQGEGQQTAMGSSEQPKERPPLSSFSRKK